MTAPPLQDAAAFPTQSQVLSALSTVHQLCLAVKDRQNASLQLHARLHQVFLRITTSASHATLPRDFDMTAFTRVVNHVRRVLEQHLTLRNAVLRLLASRRFLASLRRVHQELSNVVTKYALARPASATMNWKQQLAVNTHLDEKTLHATLRALLAPSSTFLTKEYGSERRQLHVLMDLVCEFAPERERVHAHSPLLLETLKMVHKRIANATGVHVRRVPRWFLPRCDVVCLDSRGVVGHGSFRSTLFRGEYYGVDVANSSSGRPHAVAIKYLWPLQDVYYTHVEHVFVQTLQQWWHIDHPNVAHVRGACHVSSPPYIVRDFTAYGSLTAYIAAVQAHAKAPKATPSRSANIERLTWELLYGAAKGLLYLHEQMQLVHGGLCCNNILVNRFGQPVLADYGMRALACEVKRHNMRGDASGVVDDEREHIRWLAPECLAPDQSTPPVIASDATSVPGSCTSTLTFASDVYAFGMCILEAVTGAVPWPNLDVAEVRTLKQNLGVLPPRPKRMHSNVWGLIQRMCVADPRQRMPLREVLREIKDLGYFGYGVKAAPHADSPNASTTDGSDVVSLAATDSGKLVVSAGTILGDNVSGGAASGGAVELVYKEHQGHQDADFLDSDSPVASAAKTASAQAQSAASSGARSIKRSVSAGELPVGVSSREQRVASAGAAAPASHGSTAAVRSTKSAELPRSAPRSADAPSRRATVSGTSDAVQQSAGAGAKATDAQTVVSRPRASSSSALRRSTSLPVASADKLGRTSANAQRTAPRSRDSATLARRSSALVGPGAHCDNDDDDIESTNIWDDRSVAAERVSDHVDVVKVVSERKDVQRLSERTLVDSSEAADEAPKAALDVEVCRSLHLKATSTSDGAPSTAGSTVEPEHEIESTDGLFVDARKASPSAHDQQQHMSEAKPSDDAPLSRTTEIRNRILSGARGGDRSSFLDNLLRATTLRTDEYMTARETSDALPPPLSTPKYVDTIAAIKGQGSSPDVVLHALQMLRAGLRRDKRDVDWTEQGGIDALLHVIAHSVSEKCTCLALDMLVEIAVQNPGDIEAMVESGAVRVLLAFIERRSASDELDLVASFLLEILAGSDTAKTQLWQCDGIRVVEGNSDIDRRLVQEVKSILAKFKSSEGYKHMNQGEYDLAIERFSDAIALDRKRATYYCDRSLAYYEASLFKKAADDAARCMRYNPYDVIGYLRNGMALKALGRYNEAIVCLRKGRQVDPKFAKIRDVISEIEDMRRGRSRDAASAEAPAVPPEEIVQAKKKDGDDALRKKQYDVAIQCYTDALAVDKRNDLIFLHRSIAYGGCGQFDRAIEDASRCIQINYRHTEGYYRLALALHSIGQFDQALRTLYRGQEVDSRHVGIRRFIQQLEQEEAKRAGLDLPSWFKERGYQAFQLRSYEEAIKFYSKGIAASKSDHDEVALHCFFYRARANQCRGEFGAVVMDCTHILHHNPKNVFARLRRADAYEQMRDYFMALQDMQELVMFNPDFESARARLESLEVRCRFLPRTNLQHVL